MTLSAEHPFVDDEHTVATPAIFPVADQDRPVESDPEADGPSLRIIRGPQQGLRFALESALVTLGRSGDADIALDDTTVSRRHAEFRNHEGRIVLRDAGSLNGTYVNRRPISGEVELADGDEVWTGKYRMVFRGR